MNATTTESNGNNEFILLPKGGIRGSELQRTMLLELPMTTSTDSPQTASLEMLEGSPSFSIIDTVHEDGPKLVTMDAETATQLNESAESPSRMGCLKPRSLPAWVYRGNT